MAKNNAAAAAAELEADLKKMREKMAKKKAPIVEAPAPKAGKKKPAIVEEAAPKRRGRPPGSGKKPVEIVEEAAPKRRGRPPGSGKKPAIVEEAPAPKARKARAETPDNSGPWSLREDGKVAHNGRVLQAERAAHYETADGGAIWIVGRTVENRSVFHATGIDGAGNALTPATFAGSPEIVCAVLNAFMGTLELA